jgi:hypothetical protein
MSDQNYFLNSDIIGDFNDPTIDNSGYGALPAAEKNQTYFAYFNGVGGTGPEIIDQTAYFIKYLIDAQGNVVTPQPNSIETLNLNQNFEIGKKVNVTSLEGTGLFVTLLGDKTTTGIGKIEPIFVTQTGSSINDYVSNVSFTDLYNSYTYDEYDFSFNARNAVNQNITSDLSLVEFSTASFNPNGNFKTGSGLFGGISSSYRFPENTSTYSNPSKFTFSTRLKTYAPATQWISTIVRIVTSSTLTPDVFDHVLCSEIHQYLNTPFNSGVSYHIADLSISSPFLPFYSGSRVRAEILIDDSSVYSPVLQSSNFKLTQQYVNPANTTSPYWSLGSVAFTGGTFVPVFPNQSNYYLTASQALGNAYTFGFQQTLPAASSTLGFSNITTVFSPQPGDFIRFEYNPLKTFIIYEVITDNPDYNLILKLNDGVPYGTQLQNCVIYRIVPNGNYMILNVKKPTGTTGQPLTGFIKPQHMTKELEDNFTTIIQKLAAEGTI